MTTPISVPIVGTDQHITVSPERLSLFQDPDIVLTWPPSLRSKPPRVTRKSTHQNINVGRYIAGEQDPKMAITYRDGNFLNNTDENLVRMPLGAAMSQSRKAKDASSGRGKKQPAKKRQATARPRPPVRQLDPVPSQIDIKVNTPHVVDPDIVMQAIGKARDVVMPRTMEPWLPLPMHVAPRAVSPFHYSPHLGVLFNLAGDLSMAEFHPEQITLIMQTAVVNGGGKDNRRFTVTYAEDGKAAVEALRHKLLSLDTDYDVPDPHDTELEARIAKLEKDLQDMTELADRYAADYAECQSKGQTLADRWSTLMGRLNEIPFLDVDALTRGL